jgi:hypothetical protein
MTSASTVEPSFVVTDPEATARRTPRENGNALLAVVVVDEGRERLGEQACADTASGKMIVTSQPFIVSAAATSEPMKPPPITAARSPSPAMLRSRR